MRGDPDAKGNHWITSSARISRDCWIVRPSALAVFRLMTNSNLVGRSIAAELVQMNPDVIVSFGAVAGVAIKNATTTIPIIATTGDPVRLGLVSNLSRPEGNITRLSPIAPELAAKRLELIHKFLPNAALIGELVDPANTYWQRVRSDYEQVFRTMGIRPLFVGPAPDRSCRRRRAFR